MDGILFYNGWSEEGPMCRIPIKVIPNCEELLSKSYRNNKQRVFKITRGDSGNRETKSEMALPLDEYKQRTLYLLVEGTEFLVKG